MSTNSNYQKHTKKNNKQEQGTLFLTKNKQRKLKNQAVNFVRDIFNIHTGLLFIIVFLGNFQASYGRYPFLFENFTKVFNNSLNKFNYLGEYSANGKFETYEVFDKYLIVTLKNPSQEPVRIKVLLTPSEYLDDEIGRILDAPTKITKKQPSKSPKIPTTHLESEEKLDRSTFFFYNESEYIVRNFFFGWTSFLFLYVALFPFWLSFTILGKLEEKKKSSKLTRAIIKDPNQNKKRLKDLAGIEKIQPDLKELVQSLKSSQLWLPPFLQKLSLQEALTRQPILKGFLLIGPPGTGKTLLAQAIAGTAGVTLLATVASEFIDNQKGVGSARLRDLFNKARKAAPAIIFIDEIDTLGKAREGTMNSLGSMNGGSGNEQKIQVFTEFLVQLDGFAKNEKVVVIGATNFSDRLDPAFIRPGRFDRLFQLDHPNQKSRIAILKLHIERRNKKYRQSLINWGRISQLTVGFTGADLSAMVNESLLYSIRNRNNTIHDTNSLEHGFYRIATYSKPKKANNSWVEKQQGLLVETQTAYYQASKQLFAIYFKKSFKKNLMLPVLFLKDRPKNPRYLTLENEVKKTEIKVLPKKLVRLELIQRLMGIATGYLLFERLKSNSSPQNNSFWLNEQTEREIISASHLINQMISYYGLVDDHLFFEESSISYNRSLQPNINWKEFWSILQNDFSTSLSEENDRSIHLNWRFFQSWAWLETDTIYTQKQNLSWGESILDEKKQENKESISPDFFYQTNSLESINVHSQSKYDLVTQMYLKDAFCEAMCILKKDQDYLDFIAYKYLLRM